MTAMAAPARVADDRLGFALCVALAVHALVIFGIGFTAPKPQPRPARLEVTLAKYHSDTAPKKADFIAQDNQEGSGNQERALNPSSPEKSPMDDAGVHPAMAMEVVPPTATDVPQQEVVSSTNAPKRLTAKRLIESIADRDVNEQIAILERSLEIARLESRFDETEQELAKKPRVRRLTSVSAKTAADAEYLLYWQHRIEHIGNLNYPAASRRNHIYGDLRLLVAIGADGKLLETTILESSGHPELDEAALRIVHLSAPFTPFPPELKRDTDRLEIIRTWHFRKNRMSAR